MTHLLTRGEQQARKHYLPHIPIMPADQSNLDRYDRGMGAEDLGEPMKQHSAAPFWFGMAGVILGPIIVIVVGVVVAGA